MSLKEKRSSVLGKLSGGPGREWEGTLPRAPLTHSSLCGLEIEGWGNKGRKTTLKQQQFGVEKLTLGSNPACPYSYLHTG